MPGPLAPVRHDDANTAKKHRIELPGALALNGAVRFCVCSSLANPKASHVLIIMTNPQSPLQFYSAVLGSASLLYFACILAGRNASSN